MLFKENKLNFGYYEGGPNSIIKSLPLILLNLNLMESLINLNFITTNYAIIHKVTPFVAFCSQKGRPENAKQKSN